MDYELRQKALEVTKERKMFLAPIKVYRELYRALLQLHVTGEWPKRIEELGLLNIFHLGAGGDALPTPGLPITLKKVTKKVTKTCPNMPKSDQNLVTFFI